MKHFYFFFKYSVQNLTNENDEQGENITSILYPEFKKKW